MKFNVILKDLIKKKGLTQRQFAARAGISETTASHWCQTDPEAKTKNTAPSVDQLNRIAAALDMPVCALLAPVGLRELICDIDGQEDVIRALLALLALVRVDDGSMLSTLRDLTDVLEKLQK